MTETDVSLKHVNTVDKDMNKIKIAALIILVVLMYPFSISAHEEKVISDAEALQYICANLAPSGLPVEFELKEGNESYSGRSSWYVDGELIGSFSHGRYQDELYLLPGKHLVRIETPNYRTIEQRILVLDPPNGQHISINLHQNKRTGN